ncbi:glycosyltransferase family 4 protein [Phragmitibacter flavus]|uniref:Glycosyltransferase family 4 protein n=1 Tax=Phragmitibacter flavus TaxID=2576071 RepID=A0A5R8KCC5_9BACT|nr:glycosyltransferase family 4 protein [Phragmitibacter flavus]TLD69948.1 glycosyltransferase family 4 protein [Phragmitibacter flavus]
MSRINLPAPRYIVAQTGARRGYAVPYILHQAGLLERLYTDVSGNSGWGKWLAWGRFLPVAGEKFRRLINRRIPEELLPVTFTFARPNLRWVWKSVWSRKDPDTRSKLDLERNVDLGLAASTYGYGKATHLYIMLSEFTPMLQDARQRGLKVVSEVYILVSTSKLISEERRKFPEWEPKSADHEKIVYKYGFERSPLTHADFYICPSECVADDLVENWNISRNLTAIVPYGVKAEWLTLQPNPIPGRILFVGTAELRKGIHYLAMAAAELTRQGYHYEFRVAGHVEDSIRNQSICDHLTFLGRIPRSQIKEEYQQADIFVLPSLAEGSAEVTYEALASALPVVTTMDSGSVARDGIEGIIVPKRDVNALVEAIKSLVENRERRDLLSVAARKRASEFTWEQYGERLVRALLSMPEKQTQGSTY